MQVLTITNTIGKHCIKMISSYFSTLVNKWYVFRIWGTAFRAAHVKSLTMDGNMNTSEWPTWSLRCFLAYEL